MSERRTIRVAGIDIGSNSTRLLIADVEQIPHDDPSAASGDAPSYSYSLVRVRERVEITRLAEQVDTRGILLPQAIARTRNALTDFRGQMRELGAVFALATATSAVRDADNGEAFLGEVEHSYGFKTELLSGEAEAALSFRGALSDRALAEQLVSGGALLVDVGGGSTEIVLARDGQIRDFHSFQIGCVRTTERFLAESDPPAPDAVVRAYQHVASALAERFPDPAPLDIGVGVAGTVTTLAMMIAGMEEYDRDAVHLLPLSAGAVAEQAKHLASVNESERETLTGVEPRRAPVIVAGAIIVECVMRHFGLAKLVTSESDILDGITLRAGEIALRENVEELAEPFGGTPC